MSTESWSYFQEPLSKPSGAVKRVKNPQAIGGLFHDAIARWPPWHRPA